MSDVQQDKRAELVEVLNEFQVTLDTSSPQRGPIDFWVNGKRISYTYDQANLRAREDLRQKLFALGARQKPRIAERPFDRPIIPPIIPSATPTSEPVTMPPKVAEPVVPPPEPVVPQPVKVAEPEPVHEPKKPSVEPDDRPQAPATPQVFTRDNGFTMYQSARVVAIELDRDLIIAKGNVLVIPLHKTNTFLDMPSEQFHILFDDVLEPVIAAPTHSHTRQNPPDLAPKYKSDDLLREAVVFETPPRPESDETAIIDYLGQRNGGVKAKNIASALNITIKSVERLLRVLQDRGIVVSPSSEFWTLASKPSPTVKPAPPPAAKPTPAPAARPPVTPVHSARSRQGVSPQVGRILAAMAYVSKTTGKTDLTTAQVSKYLDARDSRQYGARLPGMLEKGFVTRGLPLADGAMRGWHYQISTLGYNSIKELGAWPYEYDSQPPPEWLTRI